MNLILTVLGFVRACIPGTTGCDLVFPCKSFTENFDSPSVLGENTFNGNPDAMPFIDQEMSSAVGDGMLSMVSTFKNGMGKSALVSSSRLFHYGTFSARIKPTGGPGLVNSFIFKTNQQSNQGDEIDFEWVFNPTTGGQTQTNYFYNGTLDYTLGVTIQQNLSQSQRPENIFQVYQFEYYSDYLRWSVDGQILRTVFANKSNGSFPVQPGYLMLSIWDTCQSSPGTQQWAFGPSKWCNATSAGQNSVFKMEVDWIKVQCLAGTDDTKTYSTLKNSGLVTRIPSILLLVLLL